MKNTLEKYSVTEKCPIRNVLDRFGDKWSVLVLLVLGEAEKMRFNELHKTIGDVSQKMLTVTLRTLEADDLVRRKVFPEIPPRVEYSISERGKSLLPLVQSLAEWAAENMNAVKKSRKKFEG